MRIIIVFVLAVFSTSVFTQDSEISDEKKSAIRQLMVKTGAVAMGEQLSQLFIQQMTQSLRQARTDIPPRAFDIISEEVQAVLSEEIDQREF
ncbi:MAG TPA: hypothetical protein DCM64_03715 [Gammaproteobacteria bacterium]|nr:hypothetical protein [Gammaproteobacteria bacterium]MDP6734322.1 hypothetical protein [Gammaproteobacteria bacterium]HAJ75543.1 hypothetical protein [Gammaproteobacteria bacterium]